MRCSICGAKLKKEEGDICVNCYKEYQEEEELKKDVNEQLRIKRKYSISYEILKYMEIIVIFLLTIVVLLLSGKIFETVLLIGISLIILGFLFFIDKRIAIGTLAIFYEKKVTYTFKFLFFNVKKTIKYSDISDVRVFQTHRQKKFGYGDLCIYGKGIIPGSSFINGFQIKNIENVLDALVEVGKIVELEKKQK